MSDMMELAERIESPDKTERLGAIEAISHRKLREGAEFLEKVIAGEKYELDEKILAVNVLGDILTRKNADTALAAMRSEKWEIRDAANDMLVKSRHVAPYLLKRAVADPREYVRANAATLIGYLSLKELLRPLCGLAGDSSDKVRKSACLALANFDNPEVLRLIVSRLKDSSEAVRHAAFQSVKKMGRGGAEQVLKTLAEAEGIIKADDIKQLIESEPDMNIEDFAEGFLVTVELPGARRQKVYLLMGRKDTDGEAVIVVYTKCGPATEKNYQWALETNLNLLYGALAVHTIQGEQSFVLVNSLSLETLEYPELRKSILAVARKGDYVEKALTQKDEF